MCRQRSFTPYGKGKEGSASSMRYMGVNKIHGSSVVKADMVLNNTSIGNMERGILCPSHFMTLNEIRREASLYTHSYNDEPSP